MTDLINAIEKASPTGKGAEWFTNTAPSGWLLCDGSAVSRATYARLFAVIGTGYGAGDGSTTFNLPGGKGKVWVGRDAAQTEFDTLGETGGEKTHLLLSSESGVPAHGHTQNSHTHIVPADGGTDNSGGPYARYDGGSSGAGVTTGSATPTINNNTPADAASAHNNLQPYQVCNFIIKD